MTTPRSRASSAPLSAMSPRAKWAALAFVVIAQLMVVLDGTIVNVALPAAQADLGFGDADRQWIITAYALAFGSLLLLGGRLADLLGQKQAFLIGLVGFALASALGGLAPSFLLLVIARAAQGVFGALLAPVALSLITTMFTDAKDRAKAFGVFSAVSASGGAAGLLLGGVLTEFVSWRWCLFVNILFAVVAIIGAVALVPRSERAARPTFDVWGVATVTVGLVGIVYGFARAETEGWADPIVLGSFVVGLALIVAFVLIEQRVANPLLPLRVVLDRDRGGALLALALTNVGLFGLFLFLTYYLQVTLGFTALQTGAAFVPLPLAIIVGSTFLGSMLLPRFGPKLLMVTGSLIAAGGLLILQALSVDGSYVGVVLPALAVIGLGVGLLYTAAMSTATSGVDAHDAGVASAAVNMVQQVGGSIGTALLSSIYAGAAAQYLNTNSGSAAVNAASVHGYHVAFAVSAAALLAVAILSGLMLRRGRDRAATDVDASAVPIAVH